MAQENSGPHIGPFARRQKEEKKGNQVNARPPVAKETEEKQTENEKGERKAPVTHKDLMISYLIDGVDGINPLLADHSDAVSVLERMIWTLDQKKQDASELRSLQAFYESLQDVGSPGRRPVKVGDSREYTVQQSGDDGECFMRVPLGTLKVKRGDKILGTFNDGEITIKVAS